MAKAMIIVLCPSGHRRKSHITPNSNLLRLLEDICNQENLDSSEWGLMHQRKKCDLTIPWRLLSIPANALLEMYKLEERRTTSDVTIQLQLPDNTRYTGIFKPSVTLREMLNWYRTQSDSMVAALDTSMNDNNKLCAVCSYMSEQVIGDYALSKTTLHELGLTGGAAVIRYNYRSVTDDELKATNDRINDKITRRDRQQQQRQEQQTAKPAPVHSSPHATIASDSCSVINTTIPSFNNEEYSIFRDVPLHRTTTTCQQKPMTLAESLGINISFDHSPFLRQQTQTDLNNFKFPEGTKGQNLYQNQSSHHFQPTGNSKPFDRCTIAYDLTSIPSTSANKTEELPESFFELTPDDLRSILNSLREQSSEDHQLETRSIRERIQSKRTVVYEHIVIRLVINSNSILQGLFHPDESVSNLMEFAQTNLVCPQLKQSNFYLFTSPPRTILSDLNKSLSAYDLVPAAYVYLGHRTVSPLIVQLVPNIRLGSIDEANQIVKQYVFNCTRPKTDNDNNACYNEQSTTETNTADRPIKRNLLTHNIDDKHIRDKLRKFLPGQK